MIPSSPPAQVLAVTDLQKGRDARISWVVLVVLLAGPMWAVGEGVVKLVVGGGGRGACGPIMGERCVEGRSG